jgi:DNA segregation ATPase FtsK/SpoIIIE-like protein
LQESNLSEISLGWFVRRYKTQNIFNRVAGGVLIAVIGLFAALSNFGALGGVGDMVKGFLTGVFGFFSYALAVCAVLLGVAILLGFKVTLAPSKLFKYAALFFTGLFALHIYTSSQHILGRNYAAYLAAIYTEGNTAGGAMLGIISYPLMKALTNAGALILVCILFLALSLVFFYPLIRREVTYKAKKSKISAPKRPELTDFSTASEGTQAKLYRIDVDAVPPAPEKPVKKSKGASGYNPLFPNAKGHVEDEEKADGGNQPFTETELAKRILLSRHFDEEAYKKYSENIKSPLNNPSAPYAVQRRLLMDGRLGIDRTGSGLKADAARRFDANGRPLNVREDDANAAQPNTENESAQRDAQNAAKPDFSERKTTGGIPIPELLDKSEWGKPKERPEFSLDKLKEDEINRLRKASLMSYTEEQDADKTKDKPDNAVTAQNTAAYTEKYADGASGEKIYADSKVEDGEQPKEGVVLPPQSPRFGSEKLRDAVVRAVNETSPPPANALSKAERLERLEKLRAERLKRESAAAPQKEQNEVRAAQITIDESMGKTLVKSPYSAPPLTLLKDADPDFGPLDDIDRKKEILVSTLASFNIEAKVINVICGPTFSLYVLTVTMPKGKTINWISVLDNDIAMKMEEVSVRILAPIPGKNAVGIEVPNKNRRAVRLKEILDSPKFNDDQSPFTFALGKNLNGEVFTLDIKKMPHLLIAGATGSGKSCCINSLIVSLLYKATPDDLRFILIDPKRVELIVYEKIPHLLMDEIIVDVDKAIKALQWVIKEMERRTEFFAKHSYRDIDEYNYYGVRDGFPKMPRIAIVIDELADLMDMGKKAVEDSINRLARLARAAGIHLIVATQRPSVDVISGTIKNNLPTRIAFKVTAGPDSKTVLDGGGAEKLLGNGDLLLMRPSSALLERLQGAFITGDEVRKVVKYICTHNQGNFDEKAKEEIFAEAPVPQKDARGRAQELPIEYFKALDIGLSGELLSVTLLQRRLRIGFPKAGSIIDQLSREHLIGEADGANKGRKVLITREQFLELLAENNLTEDDLY